MTFWTALLLVSVALIGLLSFYFIVCRNYEDGVIGNIALGLGILIPAGAIVVAILERELRAQDLPAAMVWLFVGLAVFVARHAYRHIMFHRAGAFGWARPRDAATRSSL